MLERGSKSYLVFLAFANYLSSLKETVFLYRGWKKYLIQFGSKWTTHLKELRVKLGWKVDQADCEKQRQEKTAHSERSWEMCKLNIS